MQILIILNIGKPSLLNVRKNDHEVLNWELICSITLQARNNL